MKIKKTFQSQKLILLTAFLFTTGLVLKVSSATIEDGNLAFQKAVTVLGSTSSTNNFSKSSKSPLNLTDGNVEYNNTLWTNSGTNVADDGASGAFVIDLGTSTTFNRFKFFRQGDGSRALPFDYQILYSDVKPVALSNLNDASVYKLMTQGTVKGHLGDKSVTLDMDVSAQYSVKARYVILYIKNIMLINNRTTYYFIGTEFEIYNSSTMSVK